VYEYWTDKLTETERNEEKRSKINNLLLCLKRIGKKEKIKAKISRRQ
jgi:hypothetical protein